MTRLARTACLALALLVCPTTRARAQRVTAGWPAATRDSRPWTRWWWMGSAVDSTGLATQLAELERAGFAGVEVTPIYGARGAESAYVPYLSPRWVSLLSYTTTAAKRLGMGVDLALGSGWRSGGPFVPAADANASLRLTTDSVRGGATWSADLSSRRIDAVVAVSGRDTIVIAHGQPAGPVHWSAPAPGPWTIYIAETRFSGDRVKRPAPGGEGYAIDVFSRAATAHFLRDFGERLAALPRGAIGAWFHDSFEYTGNGSPELFATFRRLRGYDLARELPALAGQGDADHVARVKSDYRETLDDMLRENFLEQIERWAHARGSLLREQAHGSPGNLLDLYATTDIPETEIFGAVGGASADPLVEKFASSAAHVAGRRLASAESFTWLGEHFTSSLDDIRQAADQLFLAGIDHLVYHGTAYSPAQAAWPGWEFYASTEFNPRNAIWHDLPAFNAYVTRVQSVLQEGAPDDDVLLYWPVWDSWHDARGLRMDFTIHDSLWLRETPVGRAAAALWDAGYGFDYVSDRQLASDVTASGDGVRAGRGRSRYGAVLVPRTEHMPPATFERLLSLARAGATVIFLDTLPADVPGLARLDERRARLAADARRVSFGGADARGVRRAALGRGHVLVGQDLESLLAAAGVRREPLAERAGVRLLRQRSARGRDYFVVYSGSGPLDDWVRLAHPAASVALLDPTSGRVGIAERRTAADGATEVHLQMDPGTSIILRTSSGALAGGRWPYVRLAGAPDTLRGAWTVSFVEGGPVLPASFRTDSLVAWTGRGDGDADRFAGTARYRIEFDAPARAAGGDWLLDLGKVAESARVRLNGRDLGVRFAHPFRIEVGALRRTGNVLEVEVTNVSANRIRDLDRRGVPWKIFHDINYVGLDYKPFDASRWPVRVSGLVGPVVLTPVEGERGEVVGRR